MNLPTLSNLELKNKIVMVRADLDGRSRLPLLTSLLVKLIESKVEKIILIGHQGRPQNHDPALSLEPFTKHFSDSLRVPVEFFTEISESIVASPAKAVLLENLRFHHEEVENDANFARQLAHLADNFVNEAFATSHREHASIVTLPQEMLQQGKGVALGPHFLRELENINRVLVNPQKPVITLLSGVKKDKLDYLDGLLKISDQVLVAGRLPDYLAEDYKRPKVLVAKLNPDKEDITLHSTEKFEEIVKRAGTIIVSGPLGKFEDPGHRLGTERVFKAVTANQGAYKLAGGGDTSQAITDLRLQNSFNWLSTGGGAMLYYLTHQTLPALKALLH